MIKPTNGRVVIYVPDDREGFTILDPKQECAATVAFVHDNGRVNLTVHDHLGVVHSLRDVQLVQPEEAKPEGGGWCHWMPFQVGQAAGADTKGV